MAFKFGTKSMKLLDGVHCDLRAVMLLAITRTPVDFSIIEGMRTLATQKKYFAAGATRTLNSRHLTGHAVDIAPYVGGKIRWDWPLFHKIAPVIKEAARELTIPIEWGGDWRSFKDGPHWQLPFDKYPKGK